MDIQEFKRVLTTFANEPADVDVRAGKVVAQVRDEIIEANIQYSADDARSLLVVENGFSYSARAWIVNRIAKLPQLADRIIAATSATPEAVSRAPFVVPTGTMSPDIGAGEQGEVPVADIVAELLRRASHPLPGATSVLYLTSDAGEGKTTVINRAAREQARKLKEKTAGSLIVPIPLSGRAFLTFDDAVIAALVNKLRFNYLYFDAFIELVRLGAVVPAFDGYEEMLVEGSKGEAVSALGNLVQRLDSSGAVFIAARKAFFEYLSFRTQARLLDAIGDRAAAFSRLAISRWTRDQFCQYGAMRGADGPENVYETVAARLGPNHPLLTRAVLVRRLFDVLEGADRAELAGLLGENPHDYFYTFVDAIVKREASEKWLARVSGDVMEPLLERREHHELLSQIALEMWQSSSSSLRFDVLDVVVDIYCEGLRKTGPAIRQIKERIKQHSLLSTDTTRGQGLAFDHEDFHNFYLGEGLGFILQKLARADVQAFLSVGLVPSATVEQAVQYLIRHSAPLAPVLEMISRINASETSYSFCKENCGSLAVRLAECLGDDSVAICFDDFFLPANILAGRTLRRVQFLSSHFQPTLLAASSFADVVFDACEFERLELDPRSAIAGCSFLNCRIDSLVTSPDGEHLYEPQAILTALEKAGACVRAERTELQVDEVQPDERIKLLERFLRVFMRHTHVDEDAIRLRLGAFTSKFFDEILPMLLHGGVLEEAPWRGQGVKRRFKLIRPMSEIGEALESSRGSFESFLEALKRP